MNTFDKMKNKIIKEGVKYPRKYHTWYDLHKMDENSHEIVNLSYTYNQYPCFEEIVDFKKGIAYKRSNGVIEEYEYKGYKTIYILVIDGHFIMENTNPNNLWKYVSENYQLSIDYYGPILPTEIRKREYTDSHEGNEDFIADVINMATNQSIDIQVQDIMRIDEYLDEDYMQSGFNEYIKYCKKKENLYEK